MNGLTFPLIFGAGVLSFLSPCVLPLVPPYLTYMSGASFDQLRADGAAAGVMWRRSVFTSLFFILGFSLIFIIFGATATAIGQGFRALFQYQIALPVFRTADGSPVLIQILPAVAGLIIAAFGLHFLGVFRIGLLDRQLRHNGPAAASGPIGGFLLGLAFAIGWTPCIGPILAVILSIASAQQTAWQGAGLLGIYSLGLGVPFLLAGLAIGPFLSFFSGFRRHLGTVEKVVGVLLLVTGGLFITGQFTQLSYWFLETFPVLNNFG